MTNNIYSQIEIVLIEESERNLLKQGFSEKDAKETARNLVDTAIAMSKKEGGYELPTNFGDVILGYVNSDIPFVNSLAKNIRQVWIPIAREDGVKDDDILSWWNLPDVARQLTLAQDLATRSALALGIGNGHITKESMAKVRRYFPIYGNPNNDTNAFGNDRALPYELKDRINTYNLEVIENDREKFTKDIESFSSFNAFIRNQIKLGKL